MKSKKKDKKEKILENYNPIKNLLKGETSRRDFIKWLGFSTASVTLAACKGPVIKSIPYVVKPDNITPGIPNYYASTMIDSFDIGSVLVKTREGRPIKIEPNSSSEYFNTTSARIQSSLLSLYDEERLKNPFLKGKKSSWKEIDNYIIQHLKYLSQTKKDIIFLSYSFPSFSTKKLIQDFKKKYPYTNWITYDPISYSKVLDASEKIFGIRGFPFFDLKESELVISFDADFLGDWSPENMAKSYALNRVPKRKMMQHIQIESNMTITGANADIRISRKPSDIKKMLIEIFQKIFFGKKIKDKNTEKIASLIKKIGSKSVILADGDQESYELSFLINKKINSHALQKDKYLFSKESNDNKFKNFLKNLEENNIGGLFIHNVNPIYSLPLSISKKVKKFIKKIPLTVSFSTKVDETNEIMDVLAPTTHWLESWGDTYPMSNVYTLIQPTIQRIFNTRQFQDSLIIWSGIKEKNYYEYLKKTWEKNIIPKSNVFSFNEALFHGVVKITNHKSIFNNFSVNEKKIQEYEKNIENEEIKKNFELKLYPKISMGDGFQYNNPWLQELPDPITRTTWDNYLTVSRFDANNMGLKNWNSGDGSLNGNCVDLIKNNKIIIRNIPVFIQPGQAIGSVGLSFGYGQKKGKLSKLVNGKNAYRIYENFLIIQNNIQLKKVDKIHKFACVQLHNITEGRDLVRETDLEIFLKNPKEIWNEEEKILTHEGMLSQEKISIWNQSSKKMENKNGHHFNLSIDLNACIGCGACIIACHSENNVPVVGKEEIKKSRDMHWLRIDRYYFSNNHQEENIFENPKVSFQPIMCQHCEHAPCETVCPVGATSHGKQGQNMMTYNRCVGTRYCANNCPYKVRRFNWFNYANNQKFDFNMNNTLGKMVLNPDVVVRTRGVMEKCSLCIQRTQYVIGIAKKENRKVKDEEFETACSVSCPTKAITFGDTYDSTSLISNKIKNTRSYKLLDFIGVRPNISYQLKIRNKKKNEIEKMK
ncbi:4Fe-4S dicluster domain-containing protein [Blattabacterium sp. (Blaberus giganteus)]|uniref:4Fe-4S dicluster domain-containing protein n=1 Tax=Blattabacterium sp. (Blaberus giganteus) TaxID=1186051 RepID=UPI00025F6E32|nr:4Fe-4S dicluster domain-containing protein [Blattabacterium sp. (Blaberus giganteus)]AFJ90516.1 molybdopterin oxidoreductase iron-sulfur binding subunit [Blattabacterium sp. (Blaberus giganteus)]